MPTLDLVSRDLRRMALAGEPLDYVLVRRRGRRGVGLKVDEEGLTVSAPATMPLAGIEAMVRASERWILAKLAEWRARKVPLARFTEGAPLPYLGGHLALRLARGRASVERRGGELQVTLPGSPLEEGVRRAVVGWYRGDALAYLGERVGTLADSAGIARPKLLISSATARWGSCNSRREVRLAWRLVKAPAALVDYVVCHELAHLRHMNHSRAFWAEVERQCPDYRERRRELFATDYLYRSF